MQNLGFYAKKYGKDAIMFLLILICLGLIIYNTFIKEEKETDLIGEIALNNVEAKNNITEEVKTSNKMHVDVKGAVKKPGVYTIDEGKIIQDVITLAGGFQNNAYQNEINLSKKLKDEMVIYVYTKTEMVEKEKEQSTTVTVNETCKVPDYSIVECVQDKVSIIETDANASSSNDKTDNNSLDENKQVNINTANVEELTSLTGIGEAKAKTIIAYREENGKFNNINDIMNVSGIGEALFEKIKNNITV